MMVTMGARPAGLLIAVVLASCASGADLADGEASATRTDAARATAERGEATDPAGTGPALAVSFDGKATRVLEDDQCHVPLQVDDESGPVVVALQANPGLGIHLSYKLPTDDAPCTAPDTGQGWLGTAAAISDRS